MLPPSKIEHNWSAESPPRARPSYQPHRHRSVGEESLAALRSPFTTPHYLCLKVVLLSLEPLPRCLLPRPSTTNRSRIFSLRSPRASFPIHYNRSTTSSKLNLSSGCLARPLPQHPLGAFLVIFREEPKVCPKTLLVAI